MTSINAHGANDHKSLLMKGGRCSEELLRYAITESRSMSLPFEPDHINAFSIVVSIKMDFAPAEALLISENSILLLLFFKRTFLFHFESGCYFFLNLH